MSADLYVALLAIFRLGMVALILDPSAGRDHTERCCALYPPQALIASTRAHLLRLLLSGSPAHSVQGLGGLPRSGSGVLAAHRPHAGLPDDPSLRSGDARAPYLHER